MKIPSFYHDWLDDLGKRYDKPELLEAFFKNSISLLPDDDLQ
jgi:hypothetical protein